MPRRPSRASSSAASRGNRSIHPDVVYAVDDASGREHIFTTPNEAAGFAVSLAMSDGRVHFIDVIVSSRAGAIAFVGSEGAARYNEDPEASVFERIAVRAEAQGRVA